ncbi:hypothetical protein SAMN05216371_0007 [Streptomyces sp. TLI_053]|uniref:hypothetical protein n=1 Tax=Streptomyces sp. TLI_053 TaxID=1855352 RepID=UPI000879694F|nr:hypothetical protein [Streptomyces sp. TLI_053]SDS47904.1 hypothetical protein SAMN05216371_0007 [Streptomyces sp. TLI_053]
MAFIVVEKPNTSLAWQDVCLKLDTPGNRRHDALHTTVHIHNATAEDPHLRAEFDRMRHERGYSPIETVANTVFPAQLAAICPTPQELVRRYRDMYPRLRRLDRANATGTYFGRIVAYPGESGMVDQLTALIYRIRSQAAGNGPMTAAYEMGLAHPGDPDDGPDATGRAEDGHSPAETAETDGSQIGAWATSVQVPGKDKKLRGFPCLSHCSFQLDRDRVLHALAHYRSHYMVERAYGNYLGLGRLLAYLAQQSEVQPGTLTVVAGHAQIEGNLQALRPVLSGQSRLAA